MNDDVSKHLEDAITQVRNLFMKAASRIEALKPGEKIPATTLADELAKEQGQTGPQLYPILKMILNNSYPGVKILRGAHGGVYKLPVTPPVNAVDEVAKDTI